MNDFLIENEDDLKRNENPENNNTAVESNVSEEDTTETSNCENTEQSCENNISEENITINSENHNNEAAEETSSQSTYQPNFITVEPVIDNNTNNESVNIPESNIKSQQTKESYQWDFESIQSADINKNQKKKLNGLKIFAVIISILFILSLGGIAALLITNPFTEYSTTESDTDNAGANKDVPSLNVNDKPSDSTQPSQANGALTGPQIASKAKAIVVGVVVYTRNVNFQQAGSGSGVIMSSDGYIITNAHVLVDTKTNQPYDAVKVVLDSKEEYDAEIVGLDTRTDLAVVKINATDLPYAEFGNSDEIEVGEAVFAVGNPSGLELQGSFTGGYVSAVNRIISDGSATSYIQTDAAINPGNSGGALVNVFGQVIGINSAKISATGYEGLGFAIPINEAKPVIDDIIRYGYVQGRVRIGISFILIDETTANYYNVPVGLQVQDIDEESNPNITKAGLQKGDIITELDGQKVENSNQVFEILKTKKPGESITAKIYRPSTRGGGETKNVSIILAEDKGD